MAETIFFTTDFTNKIKSTPESTMLVCVTNNSGGTFYVPISYFHSETLGVDSVTGTGNISVNNTDPQNPIVATVASPTFTTVTATTFVGSVAAAKIQISGTTIESTGTDATVPLVLAVKGADAMYFNVNSGTRWYINQSMFSPKLDNTYDIGFITTAVRNFYTATAIQKGAAAEGYAQRKHLTATATKSFAGEVSVTIAVAVPAGAKIVGAALRNDTLVKLGGGGVSLSFAYSGGSTQAIESGVAPTENTKSTKFYDTNADSDIATATTNITVTPDVGTLDTGSVTAVVFYEQLVELTDPA